MSGLKAAARRYIKTAFGVLDEACSHHEAGHGGLPRWERHASDPNLFALREPEMTAPEACLHAEAHRLPEGPESIGLHTALSDDSRLASYIDNLVGTPMTGSRIEPGILTTGLLWAVFRESGTFLFTEEAFTRGYTTWLDRTLRKTEGVTILSPLSPLSFDGQVVLEGGLEIDQLTDDEVSTCLYVGAIETPFAPHGLARIRQRVGIRAAVRHPRGLFDEFSDDDRDHASKLESRASGLAEEVVTALRVFTSGRVALRGQVLVREDGSMQFGRNRPARPTGEPMRLTRAHAQQFAPFWATFRAATANPVVNASVRRFSFAGERVRRDDEIVDLVAALEALVLAGIDDRRELTYRTALRGAVLLEAPGPARRLVQKQFQRAYAVRSAVAHGGTPRSSDLRLRSGAATTLDEFAESAEELVRAALKKVIAAVADGADWPPDWDALILEGTSYP